MSCLQERKRSWREKLLPAYRLDTVDREIVVCRIMRWRGSAPKPPLCKGRWQKSSIFAGGVLRQVSIPQSAPLPTACGRSGRGSDSPPDCHSLPRLRFAYPLHKGALALPRQCIKQWFVQGNDTEHPPMVLRQLQAVVTHLPPAMPANNNLSLDSLNQ